MAKIRILVVEDHKILLGSLCLLLGTIDNIEIVGQATNGKEALQILDSEEVDIIMTDLGMPIMNGIDTLPEIIKHFPYLRHRQFE